MAASGSLIGLFEAIDRVVKKFVQDKTWRLAARPEHRHAASFIRRRANVLFRANPKWEEEDKDGFPSITGRLNSELAEVDRYLTDKLGDRKHRGPLYGGTDTATPKHLDLADVAQRRTNEPSTTLAAALAGGQNDTQKRVRAYLELRRTRVTSIVWRAVALHEILWTESTDHKTATLNRAAMDEVLDRRLRTLEWLNFTISDHGPLGGDISPLTLNGPTGPWLDGFRIRMFEYPRVLDRPAYRGVLAGKIAPNDSDQFRFKPPFAWVPDNGKLLYNRGPYPGIHFVDDTVTPPTGLRTSFVQTAGSGTETFRLRIVPAAGLTVANVVDQVFTFNTDVWKRSWLFCDQVIAALHIEALLFAMRRRTPDGTQRFNAIAAAHPAGFFSFDSFIADDPDNPGGDPNEFGRDPRATADRSLIENVFIPLDDLQPGDHLIFWNSQLYQSITSGDWKLENSLVMDVDSDPDTGGVKIKNLVLQGHGTPDRTYADFQIQISEHLKDPLKVAITAARNRPAGATEVKFRDTRLVSWTPYGSFLDPGAWWVEVNVDKDNFQDDVKLALDSIPKSLALDPAPGDGYTPPPKAKAVYFPLFEPQVTFRTSANKLVQTTGWRAYIDNRLRPGFRVSRRLVEIKADSTLLPGLYRPSSSSKPLQPKTIEVIRPAVIL